MSNVLVTDELGPRGRRRLRFVTVAASLFLAALIAVALTRLAAEGQLEAELYTELAQGIVFERLLLAFVRYNLAVALTAMGLSLAIGLLLALGRLSRSAAVSRPVGAFVEFFRSVPVLLFIFLAYFGLPEFGIDLGRFGFVVVALTAYHSAVLAEIYRAGILSLSRGQSEAAYSIGMTYWQSMFLVVLPQAVRRMLPAIVSQLVTLIKDTTLAYIIGTPDMLREGTRIAELLGNRLQTLLLVALIFIAVNYALSRFANWLERRQRRRYGGAVSPAPGTMEDATLIEQPEQVATAR